MKTLIAASSRPRPSADFRERRTVAFEVSNLHELNGMTSVPIVQLLDAAGRPYDFVVDGEASPAAGASLTTASPLG